MDAQSQICLFVEIHVKPGKQGTFLSKLEQHAAGIRKEAGCELLTILTDTNHPDNVLVWEVWTTRELWDQHMVNDASKAWGKIAKAYVYGEKITVMKPKL